jgi:hypothetical protein
MLKGPFASESCRMIDTCFSAKAADGLIRTEAITRMTEEASR